MGMTRCSHTRIGDREAHVGDQRFEYISFGEDRAFRSTCHRRGISTLSADRFNFTQIRSTHNTGQPGDDAFMAGAHRIDPDDAAHRIDRWPPRTADHPATHAPSAPMTMPRR